MCRPRTDCFLLDHTTVELLSPAYLAIPAAVPAFAAIRTKVRRGCFTDLQNASDITQTSTRRSANKTESTEASCHKEVMTAWTYHAGVSLIPHFVERSRRAAMPKPRNLNLDKMRIASRLSEYPRRVRVRGLTLRWRAATHGVAHNHAAWSLKSEESTLGVTQRRQHRAQAQPSRNRAAGTNTSGLILPAC